MYTLTGSESGRLDAFALVPPPNLTNTHVSDAHLIHKSKASWRHVINYTRANYMKRALEKQTIYYEDERARPLSLGDFNYYTMIHVRIDILINLLS